MKGNLELIGRYRPYFDMVELRLDLLKPSERSLAADLPEQAGVPTILSARLPRDGGNWETDPSSEAARETVLVQLLESGGWAFVDLEADLVLADVEEAARASGTRIIRSKHDFSSTLLQAPISTLVQLVRSMGEGGAVPKLAVSCENSRQLLALTRAAIALEDVREKILLGMNEYGSPSRILADRLGSLWTYSSAMDEGSGPPAAPGQLDPKTLQELYRYRDIDARTPLYGVIGNPIAHSRSPLIHNQWLQDSGLPGCYLPIRSDDAAATLETCDILGIRGLSVTVPHKETALRLCDYSGYLARRIGAANTLLRAGDGWRARNTDAAGFLAPLPAALGVSGQESLKGMRALIIGAGGAARAAVYALSDAGMSLVILNRTLSKAEALAGEVGAVAGRLEESSRSLLSAGIDVVIQTTTVGMHPDVEADPIPWFDFRGTRLVYDMIYEPRETRLLARARSCGLETLNGLAMLDAQARLQFELFTGQTPAKSKQPKT